jgi:hypothetical protein
LIVGLAVGLASLLIIVVIIVVAVVLYKRLHGHSPISDGRKSPSNLHAIYADTPPEYNDVPLDRMRFVGHSSSNVYEIGYDNDGLQVPPPPPPAPAASSSVTGGGQQ